MPNNFNTEQPYLMDSAPGAFTIFSGKQYSYFGGTSYYELHKDNRVIDASIDALRKYGVNSSSSRSSYGTTQLLLDVEKEAAQFFDCENAVYLSSGFLTDMAAMQVFAQKEMMDVVFIDEISHYSNEYASRLSGLPVVKFSHLDYNDLESKVNANLKQNQKPLVITDGVFPIFGKIAPLDKYSEIIKKWNGVLWVDDAHSLGVLGANGRGTYEHYGLSSSNLFFGGTLSKAFGGFGGIIPGLNSFINLIKNSHLQNGSTPPPASAAAASLEGLKIVKANPLLKQKLWENAGRLKCGLRNIGIETDNNNVPICAWTMNSKIEMQKLQQELMKKDIVIQYINYVGSGKQGALRIVVFSSHTNEQIDNLLSELKKII